MRLWLKDSERRTDPPPVTTDDRLAILVGIGLWLIGLVVFLALQVTADNRWWVWTCVIALALGVVGLIYTHLHRRG